MLNRFFRVSWKILAKGGQPPFTLKLHLFKDLFSKLNQKSQTYWADYEGFSDVPHNHKTYKAPKGPEKQGLTL